MPPPPDRVLEACEATTRRMAYDRRYFARPARTLFSEIREEFALADQVGVYMVIERYVSLAAEHLDLELRAAGQLLRLLGQMRRRAVVARPVGQFARQLHAAGDGLAAGETLLHGLRVLLGAIG